VLLGLKAQPREDTGLAPAKTVFGAQIVLPNKFLQNDEFSVDAIVKHFSKTLHVSLHLCLGTILAPICPESCSPSPSSGSVGAAWFYPFSRSTTAPTQSCAAAPAPSPSESGRGTRGVVALSRLKACSPRRSGRPLGLHPGSPAATKRVSFSDPLVSSPFLHGEEVLARPGPAAPLQVPQTRYRPRQRKPPNRLDL
jgi:hypothetical protein